MPVASNTANATSGGNSRRSGEAYEARRRLRATVQGMLALVGVLLLSMPAWILRGASTPVRTVVAGAGAVLLSLGLLALLTEVLNPIKDEVGAAFEDQLTDNDSLNFAGIVRSEVEIALTHVTQSGIEFGPRAKLFQRLAIDTAQEEVLIQGISLSQKWQTAQLLEERFKTRPDFKARILLMHPYSAHAALRDADLDFQSGTIRRLIDETITPMSSLQRTLQLGERLEVRGYFSSPYYGLLACDRRRMVLSLSRESRGGDQNRGIYIDSNSLMPHDFIVDTIGGFEERWKNAKGLLEYVEGQFVPGSESRNGRQLTFELKFGRAIEPATLVVTIDGNRATGVTARAENIYQISAIDSGKLSSVQVSQAMSDDGKAWLRAPVEFLIP